MEFRNLKKQYSILQDDIDKKIMDVLQEANFISGHQVKELEEELAEYTGMKYCITCANGTDALSIALMIWGIGCKDAVFVPDFTFFSTAEVVALCGATPIFIDVYKDTYNINCEKLEESIVSIINEGKLIPKAIIPVDLFGQPSNYDKIKEIANKYGLLILEDGAQGFGGEYAGKKACSFGDIATTSFFPAKPLGCYGDGGAIFTDNEEWAQKIRSLCVHGKGDTKYQNVRIGFNSRLDTIQAAILQVKLKAFIKYELESVNHIALKYNEKLKNIVTIPTIHHEYMSSWAQYVIQLENVDIRNRMKEYLAKNNIPTMIYYPIPLHKQEAFKMLKSNEDDLIVTNQLVDTVLALPIHPYMEDEEINLVAMHICKFMQDNTR